MNMVLKLSKGQLLQDIKQLMEAHGVARVLRAVLVALVRRKKARSNRSMHFIASNHLPRDIGLQELPHHDLPQHLQKNKSLYAMMPKGGLDHWRL
jgi:hypothetical protein